MVNEDESERVQERRDVARQGGSVGTAGFMGLPMVTDHSFTLAHEQHNGQLRWDHVAHKYDHFDSRDCA